MRRAWTTVEQALGRRRYRRLAVLFVVGFPLAVVAEVARSHWDELAALLVAPDWRALAVATLLYPATLVLQVWLWHWIAARVLGARDFALNCRIYCYSALAQRLPLGPSWQLAGRIVFYRQTSSASATAVATGLEKLGLVGAGTLVAVVCSVVGASSVPGLGGESMVGRVVLLVGGLSLVAGLGLAIGRQAGLWRWLEPLRRLRWPDVVVLLAGYGFAWVLGGLVLYFFVGMVQALPANSLVVVTAAWAVAGVAGFLAVVAPSGLGVREISLAALLSALLPWPVAALVAIGYRLFLMANEVAWTGLLLGAGRIYEKWRNPA